jgi:hypothetical protein
MDIKNSIVAILNTDNEIVGTGFVAADCLIVTCAHVVDLAQSARMVRVRFAVDNSERFADVDASAYSPKDELDVAILRVSQTPKGVQSLRMSASAGCPGHAFFASGYPKMGHFESLSARGDIISLEKDKRGDPYLQLRSQEVAPGMSGGPVLDTARNAVVGMVNSGFLLRAEKRHRDTAFATPSETIWQVCPKLKPTISPLPRCNPIVEGINLLPYDYDQRIQNFLTEYLGTDSHPVPFGGRDEALHMLDNWLAETTPYLLLAAPAGRGKSALLVRWLDSLKAREDLALAFVPVSIRFGTNMERVFYAALAARLACLHGDDVPASPETSTAVYRGLVSDYLSKPLANGRTLLVVLDGLDEAADWQAGADFMPNELPAGVRVVVSARFLAGDADSTSWLRRLNWERSGLAFAPFLTPLNRAGVADVLLKMGCPLDELSRNVDIVAELYRLSEGDPLLVGLYVGDLWVKGTEVTRLKPEDLAGIQTGYDGYFDRWWEDQKKLWGNQNSPHMKQHVQTILNMLSAAFGPLKRDELLDLIGENFNSFSINDALEYLQRFVIGDGNKQGYSFGHSKLSIYFWERLSKHEQHEIDFLFVSWGEKTLNALNTKALLPQNAPKYIIQHYVTHLGKVKFSPEDFIVFLEPSWAQVWFEYDGTYNGYLQDVRRVWKICSEANTIAVNNNRKAFWLGTEVKCALIIASIQNITKNVSPDLLKLLLSHKVWTSQQAFAYIRPNVDDLHKGNLLLSSIPFLDQNELIDALQIAREIHIDSIRIDVFIFALNYLEQSEKSTIALESLRAAQNIVSEEKRGYVLNKLIRFLPITSLDIILEQAAILENKWNLAYILIELAKRLPDYTQGDRLVKIAEGINNNPARAWALVQLVRFFYGDKRAYILNKALVELQEIKNIVFRSKLFVEIEDYLPEAERELINKEFRGLIIGERSNVSSSFPDFVVEITIQSFHHFPKNKWDDIMQETLDYVLGMKKGFPYKRAQKLCALYEWVSQSEKIRILDEILGEILGGAENENLYPDTELLEWLIDNLPGDKLVQIIALVVDKQKSENILQMGVGDQKTKETRINLRIKLIQKLPQRSLVKVLTLLTNSENRDNHRELCALADRMPEKLLRTAIKSANKIGDTSSLLLYDLIKYLPLNELPSFLSFFQKTFEDDLYISASLFTILRRKLGYKAVNIESILLIKNLQNTEDRFLSMGALSFKFSVTLAMKEMLTAARQKALKLYLLGWCIGFLVSNFPDEVLDTMIDKHDHKRFASRVLNDDIGENIRFFALLLISKYSPERILNKFPRLFSRIKNQYARAFLLSILAKKIKGDALIDKTLRLSEELQDNVPRIYAMSAFFAKLKDDQQKLISDYLFKGSVNKESFGDYKEHLSFLNFFAEQMKFFEPKMKYRIWNISLVFFSEYKRVDVFSALRGLMPISLSLGDNNISTEIFNAFKDVTTRWP